MKGRNSRGKKDFDRVGALLRRVLPRGAEEKLALPDLRKEWEALAGAVLGKKTLPLDIEKGVLLVCAESPAAAKSLSMRAGTVAKAASAMTGLTILSLKVVVGKTAAAPKKILRPRHKGKITPPREEVHKALEEIRSKFSPEREQVARRLASLMALYRARFPGR